jgi:hypothetical protein
LAPGSGARDVGACRPAPGSPAPGSPAPPRNAGPARFDSSRCVPARRRTSARLSSFGAILLARSTKRSPPSPATNSTSRRLSGVPPEPRALLARPAPHRDASQGFPKESIDRALARHGRRRAGAAGLALPAPLGRARGASARNARRGSSISCAGGDFRRRPSSRRWEKRRNRPARTTHAALRAPPARPGFRVHDQARPGRGRHRLTASAGANVPHF